MNEELKTAWDYVSIILLAIIAVFVLSATTFLCISFHPFRLMIIFIGAILVTYFVTRRVARMYLKNDFPWQRNKKKD